MSEPWCDYGDLPKSSCDHCRTGKIGPELRTAAQRGAFEGARSMRVAQGQADAVKEANFQGTCPECRESINIDDLITVANGGWVHVGCA